MSKRAAQNGKPAKSKTALVVEDVKPKKTHVISDIEKEKLKLIAEKAKKMRIAKNMSYEQFALHAVINRNSYFRFEKSAFSGDNYTVSLLLKVIMGLETTLSEFFKDIQ
jgi:DNA-binding XRE family transcriptional regulator